MTFSVLCYFFVLFVLFEQIHFKKVNSFFEQLQKPLKKVKDMSFFFCFCYFFSKMYLKAPKSTKK